MHQVHVTKSLSKHHITAFFQVYLVDYHFIKQFVRGFLVFWSTKQNMVADRSYVAYKGASKKTLVLKAERIKKMEKARRVKVMKSRGVDLLTIAARNIEIDEEPLTDTSFDSVVDLPSVRRVTPHAHCIAEDFVFNQRDFRSFSKETYLSLVSEGIVEILDKQIEKFF